MKVLCFILATFVFALSTVPCCWEEECNNEVKSEQSSNHSTDHQDNDCTNCSPFLTCGSCAGFTFKSIQFNFPKPSFLSKITIPSIYKNQILLDFVVKIWQPPKISF